MRYKDKKILVAEDEPHISKLIAFRLKKEGLDVKEVKDGMEALSEIRESSWDVVILDLMMPKMGGLEVIKEVRKDPVGRDLPILVLTAKGAKSDAASAAEVGASRYLKKPFEPDQLYAVVSEMLDEAEFLRIQKEFIGSFTDRAEAMKKALDLSCDENWNWNELFGLVHKLAGAAASYGFSQIGRLAEELEEKLENLSTSKISPEEQRELSSKTVNLIQLLEEANESFHSGE